MKNPLTFSLTLFLGLVIYSASLLAFSAAPDNSEQYTPADWENSQSAEDDAKNALKHNDQRLLGFALRGYSIPGAGGENTQAYIDKCGIRLFEEFGDVIRDNRQLMKMKQAREYAAQYNKVILTGCNLDNNTGK